MNINVGQMPQLAQPQAPTEDIVNLHMREEEWQEFFEDF